MPASCGTSAAKASRRAAVQRVVNAAQPSHGVGVRHLLSNRTYDDKQALKEAGCAAFNSLTEERIQSVCGTAWIMPENERGFE